MQERRERLAAGHDSVADGSSIVKEVDKLAHDRAFITCPMGGETVGAGPRPPPWVKSVLVGIEEGRLHDRDFYTNQW